MIRNRVLYALLLIVMAGIFVYTNTYFTLLLLVLTIALPILSLILMLISAAGLSVRLSVPYAAEKKEAVISCLFDNYSYLPIARASMDLTLENQITGSVRKKQIIASVESRGETEGSLAIKDCRVGMIVISIDKVRVFDVFCLFSKKVNSSDSESIIIMPDMKDIDLELDRPIETGSDSDRFSPFKPGSDVSETFALREYIPGDEVRKINWKLSSKVDKTIVRDFSMPLNYSIFLLLELKRTDEDLVDKLVEYYLSLSKELLERGLNHTLAWYDAGPEEFHMKPMDSFEDLDLACSEVLTAFASEGDADALGYYHQAGHIDPRCILLYVTASPQIELIEEIESQQEMMTYIVTKDPKQMEAASSAINVTQVMVEKE